MKTFIYKWLALMAINVASQLLFWGLITLMGYQWSWKLYWSAFAVYMVLRVGEGLVDLVAHDAQSELKET